MYLVFTGMPGENYSKRLRFVVVVVVVVAVVVVFVLFLYLCYVFRALINSLVC